ncbi:uncharacterized protein LOC143907693 [Temnothorax americanus]|uniref:uncharacterized protein LOC143907693 n=1 Tax=Temnothorax americanus TaxID=1964332 RepID=UPI004068DE9F
MKHFDEKISEILTAISSAKQSILYDIEKKIDEVKNTIAVNTIGVPGDNVRDIKDKLGFVLPINTIEQFLSFEADVAASKEKKEALTNLYRIIICGESCLRKGVKNIMTATLSKATDEMEYSAFGRQIHGLGKRNFNKTETYSCMKDVLRQKFGNSEKFKAFHNILSRWLSGARDREGGRKERNKDVPVPETSE